MIVLGTKTSLAVDGITYYRWHYFRKTGIYALRFRIVSTNSNHRQGISLHFSNFKGELLLNGEKLEILKGFKHYVFKEGEIPNNEFVLSVNAVDGSFFIGNASEREDISTFTCGAFGSAVASFRLEACDPGRI